MHSIVLCFHHLTMTCFITSKNLRLSQFASQTFLNWVSLSIQIMSVVNAVDHTLFNMNSHLQHSFCGLITHSRKWTSQIHFSALTNDDSHQIAVQGTCPFFLDSTLSKHLYHHPPTRMFTSSRLFCHHIDVAITKILSHTNTKKKYDASQAGLQVVWESCIRSSGLL